MAWTACAELGATWSDTTAADSVASTLVNGSLSRKHTSAPLVLPVLTPLCPLPVPRHRPAPQVLLFCTQTRALDVIEEYLDWRGFEFCRLDGATAAGERGELIRNFNRPGGLSVRLGFCCYRR